MEAGGKKLVTALHFRSPRFGSVLELGARSFTPTEGTMPLATTILHQNVLEDGLTDAPNAVGFSPEFRHAFQVLLCGLGGDSFFTFESTRDFTELPKAVPATSIDAFIGSIDNLYNSVYHIVGGEALLDGTIPLRNSLRVLFLHMTLADPSTAPSPTNRWSAPSFEAELTKLSSGMSTVRSVRDTAFDAMSPLGCLEWDRVTADRIDKRGTSALHKWLGLDADGKQLVRGLQVFVDPPPTASADPATSDALRRFLRVARADANGVEANGVDGAEPLITMHLDGSGQMRSMGTLSFHSAMRALLVQLCEHGAHTRGMDAARAAVDAFCGASVETSSAPGAWACSCFARLAAEVHAWTGLAHLPTRHARVCDTVRRVDPDVITLVEMDETWREQPLPTAPARAYALVHGRGQAGVLYDALRFAPAGSPGSVAIPRFARSAHECGDADGDTAHPKSSAIVLLRRLADGMLHLVCAAHLESGKPSDTLKVALRAREMRALLAEVDAAAAAIAQSTAGACVVVLCGDLNALREEFVHGNTDAFYACEGVTKVMPRLKRPRADAARADPPKPPIARLGTPRSELQLACPACDGGWLCEASDVSAPGVRCTRAGAAMVIDFVLLGLVRGSAATLASPTAIEVVGTEDEGAAADAADGVRRAIISVGSDHLPVACRVLCTHRASGDT